MKFNSDGDLVFTAAKDHKPTVWYADSGERLGTFGNLVSYPLLSNCYLTFLIDVTGPHGGAVWDCDPSWDSKYLVTACADANARLFEVNNGNYIARMPHKG